MSRYRMVPSSAQKAMAASFDPANPAGRPSWRKAGRDEGFRIVALKSGHVRRLSRKTGEVWVPKAGWVRVRWSRAVLHGPGLTGRERARMWRLERKLARAERGSGRRSRVRLALARLRARETDRRKDWAEKASTDIVRRFDLIRVEKLQIQEMTRSAKGTTLAR